MAIQEELTINLFSNSFLNIKFLDLWQNIPEIINFMYGCNISQFIDKYKNI